MSHLDVALVAAERTVWSGQAKIVVARTTEGEYYVAAAPEGFISVANDRVSILAEHAEMAHEIDLEEAKRDLERAHAAGSHEEDHEEHVERAEARVRAAELQG